MYCCTCTYRSVAAFAGMCHGGNTDGCQVAAMDDTTINAMHMVCTKNNINHYYRYYKQNYHLKIKIPLHIVNCCNVINEI